MNISQPIDSAIGAVNFKFLSSEEIRKLSVKEVRNVVTFDNLLHPTPAGLYDPALGAYSDNVCATCHLNTYACPGHCGHISLPVPVYHPTFMSQLLRLLRARCVYCNHLRMHPAIVHIFVCKLRLLRQGLVKEAADLENIHEKAKIGGANESSGEEDASGEDTLDDETDRLRQQRDEFVRKALKHARKAGRQDSSFREKHESVSSERRAVIKQFLAKITQAKECGTCHGLSPSFRKDSFSKIFQITLHKKAKAKMAASGFKTVNPLVQVKQDEQDRTKLRNHARDDRMIDEGIDIDDASIDEEGEGEEVEMLEVETQHSSEAEQDITAKAKKSSSKPAKEQVFVNPKEVHAAISLLFEKEKEIFELLYHIRSSNQESESLTADMFFIFDILVPPSKYRPEAKVAEGGIAEASSHTLYKQILTNVASMNQIGREIEGLTQPSAPGLTRRNFNDLQTAWVRLQDSVNSLIDSDRNPMRNRSNQETPEGIKQKLEKKEGLFRKNMMGKRVNFAARSVISPDPNIETNEIGVPPVFAKKLTYPEPVTNHNFYEMKEAVLNGVDKWPGAAAIENENGQVINLRTKNLEERQALANQLLAPSNTSVSGARNKKVHRHLTNGDVVLMNRQPTLHKPSIMGHRARILPGEKTLRMHYANCNTYNADFDGDEMNMHFPQNEVARAEALQIADTDHQYLVATSGKPLRGLIQDHISMGVWLTNKDTLFDRENYQQLLYSCIRPEDDHTESLRIECVPPAILKPKQLWTGKQIITSVLTNIKPSTHPGLTLQGKSQIKADRWGEDSEEGTVIFQDGELLCGILDKAHLGPTGGGFVHAIHEAYGHTIAGRLLGVLGRLLTKLLHMRAFSCSIEDLVFTPSGDATRREKLRDVDSIGVQVAAKYVTLDEGTEDNDSELLTRLEDVLHDEEKQRGLDAVYNSRTAALSSDITAACLPCGLRKPFPQNQMQAMTVSGAKGSLVNANQISCNLGQQVLEGRRVPIMVSGKSLPCFKPFETNVRAGGYVTDRFLTGVRPQAYYFHAMAGREGLIDTAVKTSRSGYLQRCLIKGMEGLRIEYDTSVRDSDGGMVQFLYGEDGLDVTKQKHLTDFKFLAQNYMSLVAQLNMRDEFAKIMNDEASSWHKTAMRKVKKTGRIDAMDPVLAQFNPGSSIGSTSESFAAALKDYCTNNSDGLIKDKNKYPDGLPKKTFATLLDMKYMKSVVDPGEAVGIVAGQSIGEPSTQMTLNTFHLAGHSTKNVTLGIPRLREIIMTASTKISTPTMTLHLIDDISEEAGERFAKGITKLTLAEVLSEARVSERIGQGIGYDQAKIFDIQLNLFPRSEYTDCYAIHENDVLHTIEFRFIPTLIRIVRKELKLKVENALGGDARPEIGQKAKHAVTETEKPSATTGQETDEAAKTREAAEREGSSDDENDDGDDDGQNNKDRQNRGAVSYEEPDEEEAAIAKESRRADGVDELEDEGYGGSPREEQAEDNSENEVENDTMRTSTKEREARIKAKNHDVARFSFDIKEGRWCRIQLEFDAAIPKIIMLNHVESTARAAVIQSIPSLGACALNRPSIANPYLTVTTEGVNLLAMHDYQHILNPHKIFTNDIAAMLIHYGVEACRSTIILEMDAVFKGHSISVDNRHLNLIADFMTRGGGFSPFNRMGMRESTSPLAKMSFETTVGFLADALLEGDWDDLRGPSARLVVGKLGRVGTGAFGVLIPVGSGGWEEEEGHEQEIDLEGDDDGDE